VETPFFYDRLIGLFEVPFSKWIQTNSFLFSLVLFVSADAKKPVGIETIPNPTMTTIDINIFPSTVMGYTSP